MCSNISPSGRKINNRIFQITDSKITGKNNNYSPYLYYKFRQAVAESKSGMTADRDYFYVITASNKARKMKNALNSLGIQFKCIVNSLPQIAHIEKLENLIFRK